MRLRVVGDADGVRLQKLGKNSPRTLSIDIMWEYTWI